MVLIHSRPADITTIKFIMWLIRYAKDFKRINFSEELTEAFTCIDQGEPVSGYFQGNGFLTKRKLDQDKGIETAIRNYLAIDEGILLNTLQYKIPEHKKFGNNLIGINKIIVLETAQSLGFTIPPYQIVCDKQTLIYLKAQWQRIICKSLGDGFSFYSNNLIIDGQRTEEISNENIESFPDSFFPTFIQKLVESYFEIRIFCHKDTIYAIATVFEEAKMQSVDIRHDDLQNNYRKIPFNVPTDLQTKIFALMKQLKLNYGSFDFILTRDSTFYFLEVNPYGQYGYLSDVGNYYLEKEIASIL